MKQNKFFFLVIVASIYSSGANAALAIDRTRVVFDGGQKSVSVSVKNKSTQSPYLAQGWIEDAEGNKITAPLTVLPPIQRIEANKSSQVRIQALPGVASLPKDRESLFYFNLREIPPRSDKPNTLQLALQTRVKLFYRPEALALAGVSAPAQHQLTLKAQGGKYIVNNPTPYYITLVGAAKNKGGESHKDFQPVMIPPSGNAPMSISAESLGSHPVLTYVNDYGGRPELVFSCQAGFCKVTG